MNDDKVYKKTCLICDGTDWRDIDYLRADPKKMIVCEGYGFVTFERFHNQIEYEGYYDKSYRDSAVVNTNNLVTTNRKIGYHASFLHDWLSQHKGCRVGEVGSATGYFLRWCRDVYQCQIAGSELTLTYRRYAKNAYDIDLDKDFDETQQYDFLSCYHTLEHIPEADATLQMFRRVLAPGGALYLSFPIWFEEMMRWGGGPFQTFDEHFHEDHVNAWSRWHVEALLRKTGWTIVKQDRQMYGWTLLLEPAEPAPIGDPPRTTDAVVTQLSDMQRAATAFRNGKYTEALRLYPQFVDAYLAEASNQVKHLDRQMQLLDTGNTLCPNTRLLRAQKGLILYQHGQFDAAEAEIAYAMASKPHDDNLIMHLGMIYLRRGLALLLTDRKRGIEACQKAVGIFDKLIKINPTAYREAHDYIAFIFSSVPLDRETETDFVAPHAAGAPHVNIALETNLRGS